MRTYLVTGGAGFIGANFIRHMLSTHSDIQILNLDSLTYAGNLENLKDVDSDERYKFIHADICDRAVLSEIFENHEIDYVVNFAAESHVDRSIESPEVFVNTNVLGTVALLDAAMQAWRAKGSGSNNFKFVQVSTDEVYGSLSLEDPKALFRETTPLDPSSPYSASKAASDFFVKAYSDTYGFPVNITRCSNNYGPFQFPEKLIPLIVNNALQHEPLPIYGDGLNVRDWLFVDDHCRAIDLVISKGRPGETYNIGGNNEFANIDIVKTIIAECASATNDDQINDRLITYVEDRKGHDRRYAIAPDKIFNDLGWVPETPFADGIRKTIAWYMDNPTWLANITSGEYQNYYSRTYSQKFAKQQ